MCGGFPLIQPLLQIGINLIAHTATMRESPQFIFITNDLAQKHLLTISITNWISLVEHRMDQQIQSKTELNENTWECLSNSQKKN